MNSLHQDDIFSDDNAIGDASNKLVSIVLATYNGEAFLAEQLESLFLQSYSNIEIIAVDDCSSDNTVKILQEHAAKHSSLRVFIGETNLGFIKNFERGCVLSTGHFIALCDQDDYWHADKVKLMVENIGEHAMIYCDSKVCDENLKETGTKISDLVNFKSWNNCLQLAVFCRIYAHATLLKRSLFNNAYPFLKVIPPDWWLPYLSTFYGGMKYFPKALVLYRQHPLNVSGVIGGKSKKSVVSKTEKSRLDKSKIRTRINAFYMACPQNLSKEKKVLLQLVKSYENFSLKNNLSRFVTFFRYRNSFLAVKKISALHRFFFCFKMMVKIK